MHYGLTRVLCLYDAGPYDVNIVKGTNSDVSTLTENFQVRKSFVDLPLQLRPFGELILRACLHKFGFRLKQHRLELLLLLYFIRME